MRFLQVLFLMAIVLLAWVMTVDALNISAHERDELSRDLRRWQKKFGNDDHVRAAMTLVRGTLTTDDLLRRLKATKDQLPTLRAANPHATFSHLTKFALLTDNEFAQFISESPLKPVIPPLSPPSRSPTNHLNRSAVVEASDTYSVDWTTRSICVPPVKFKGNCGSNWAIMAAAAVSSAHCLATGDAIFLSAQQVLSCSYPRGTDVCKGAGFAQHAMEWLVSHPSILCKDSAIPYTSGETGSAPVCSDNTKCAGSIPLHTGPIVTMQGEDALTKQLQLQPVVAYVTALNPVWKSYKGGILTWCPPAQYVDQAMLVVGYGTHDAGYLTKPMHFFKLRNAWGTNWGEKGDIRLDRRGTNDEGMCKLFTYLAYPELPPVGASKATRPRTP
ncbi:hypothetical protein SPRG_06048 [Saprolegnia parasitica CBS 223.65]|uniref:Peptidase C1A papain C-terminal domain-containing protein n=1 Tax=Saprolegnia parasitica (strain CBS 223.65) TaxID=695850 RepID=A0A067CQ54_SAPPC|nr:hypothetical protein SPRG_06048 [Saprolegnia parasitica CBS 223.65]KDO28947.1 hypothetical protein SPRG_06048 [Saprolegnia parasitica CBS 223.65]|eukprot:XP_012200163.1 hypothetical protein SPRG_06048 [Saprolegnia parasitica CBS 223.65]